jgi:hypothetical protein
MIVGRGAVVRQGHRSQIDGRDVPADGPNGSGLAAATRTIITPVPGDRVLGIGSLARHGSP